MPFLKGADRGEYRRAAAAAVQDLMHVRQGGSRQDAEHNPTAQS
jgi:hypothetical protein